MDDQGLIKQWRGKVAALTGAGLLLMVWLIVSPAAAQQIRCEDVSYSEVIVTKCSPSNGDPSDTDRDEGVSADRAEALDERGSRRGVDVPNTILYVRPTEAEILDEMLRTLDRPDKSIDLSALPAPSDQISGTGSAGQAAGSTGDESASAPPLNAILRTADSSGQTLVLVVWIGLLVIGLAMFVVGRWVSRPELATSGDGQRTQE